MPATVSATRGSSARAVITLGEVLGLLRRAERAGADPSDILRRAKVPHRLADFALDRPALIATRHLVAIYRECVLAIGWQASRMDGKAQMQPGDFRLMCHCIITSPTLREAIERQVQFFDTHSERISKIGLAVTGGLAAVSVDTLRRRPSLGAFLSDLVGMVAFARLYAWLLGIGEEVFRVDLFHSSRFANDAILEFSGVGVRFDRNANGISFPAEWLDRPLMRSPTELEELLVQFPFDFLSRRLTAIALGDRVRSLYTASLGRGDSLPTLDMLAAETGQSASTLRRRLAAEATSVRKLRDEARHACARSMLERHSPKVEDLSQRLGFRDVDSFRRAFRRWTGTTPSALREMTADMPVV